MSKEQRITASEVILRKIASRDASVGLLVKQAAMMKKSGIGEFFSELGGKIKGGIDSAGKATKDYFMDVNNIKDLGIGAATAAGTYGLSGLIPGADKARGYRLLASLAAGTGATIYGDEIRAGTQKLWDKTPWGQQEIARANAEAKALADERARSAKAISERDATIGGLQSNVTDLQNTITADRNRHAQTIADNDATIGNLQNTIASMQKKIMDEQAEVDRLNTLLVNYRRGINNADLGGVFTTEQERRNNIIKAILEASGKQIE